MFRWHGSAFIKSLIPSYRNRFAFLSSTHFHFHLTKLIRIFNLMVQQDDIIRDFLIIFLPWHWSCLVRRNRLSITLGNERLKYLYLCKLLPITHWNTANRKQKGLIHDLLQKVFACVHAWIHESPWESTARSKWL